MPTIPLTEYVSSPLFLQRLQEVMKKFDHESFADLVQSILKRIAAGELPYSRIIDEIEEQTLLARDAAFEIYDAVEEQLLKEYLPELEALDDKFYAAKEAFLDSFSFKLFVDEAAKKALIAEDPKRYSRFAWAIGERLLKQIDDLKFIDLLSRPATIGGTGVSESVAKEVLSNVLNLEKTIEKYQIESGIYQVIVSYLAKLGFKPEDLVKETLAGLESIKTIIMEGQRQLAEEQSGQATTVAGPAAPYAPVAPAAPAQAAESLGSLMDQLSKELGDDGKQQ